MQPDETPGTKTPSEAEPLPPPSELPLELEDDETDSDIPVIGWAVGWGKAIVLGIKDTAHDMLEEGRRASHEAYDAGWREFDSKTKYRRKK